jgi:predicted xylose isomerase-like sugar epimerase
MEQDRSVEVLKQCAPWFVQHVIKGAVEPIRGAEVSLVRSFEEAKNYIGAADSNRLR